VNARLAHRAHTAHAIYEAVHAVFWALVVVAVLGLVAETLLPRKVTALDELD